MKSHWLFPLLVCCHFFEVDTSCDGLIDWNKFCTYLLLYYKERDYMKAKKEIFLGREPLIRHCVQNKVSGEGSALVTEGGGAEL